MIQRADAPAIRLLLSETKGSRAPLAAAIQRGEATL